jgi:hypothetical protein
VVAAVVGTDMENKLSAFVPRRDETQNAQRPNPKHQLGTYCNSLPEWLVQESHNRRW